MQTFEIPRQILSLHLKVEEDYCLLARCGMRAIQFKMLQYLHKHLKLDFVVIVSRILLHSLVVLFDVCQLRVIVTSCIVLRCVVCNDEFSIRDDVSDLLEVSTSESC